MIKNASMSWTLPPEKGNCEMSETVRRKRWRVRRNKPGCDQQKRRGATPPQLGATAPPQKYKSDLSPFPRPLLRSTFSSFISCGSFIERGYRKQTGWRRRLNQKYPIVWYLLNVFGLIMTYVQKENSNKPTISSAVSKNGTDFQNRCNTINSVFSCSWMEL